VVAAPLTATGLLAHAVHLGLILLGTAGVVAMLAPGWHAARVERRASNDRPTRTGRLGDRG
jgi:hypothetical protein